MSKYIMKPLKLLIILIVAYCLLLTIVFIPNSGRLINHVNSAVEMLNEEGDYRVPILAYSGENGLDNVTDRSMLGKAIGKPNISPMKAAFSGYARYWHGYVVFLRPLLFFFSYDTIRYLGLFHFTVLMICIVTLLAKNLGILYAILFGFIMSMCNYNIIPYSLQFSSVFYVMMYAMLVIMLSDKTRLSNNLWLACIFLTIGSITNFIDFLTAPLLTLGIPFILCYILRNKYKNFNWINNFYYIFIATLYWGVGYAFTWISKWIISYFIDSSEIIDSLIFAIQFRLFGGEHPDGNVYELNRTLMLVANVRKMYPPMIIGLGIIIISIFLLIIIKHHKSTSTLWSFSPILFLCAYPYIWYMVLANHSHIHSFFTYRIQAITIFAFGAFLLNCLPEHLKIINLCPNCILRMREKYKQVCPSRHKSKIP